MKRRMNLWAMVEFAAFSETNEVFGRKIEQKSTKKDNYKSQK